MNFKVSLPVVLLLFILFFACKKSGNAPSIQQITQANIDSMVGTYTGTTSGDSIYSYLDTNTGITVQTLHTFSWPDTLLVTSLDSATITTTSKYYTISYTYGDSLTSYDSVTTLQNETLGQNGYVTYNTVFLDTANSINHVVINTWYNYYKHLTTNVTLYKRP